MVICESATLTMTEFLPGTQGHDKTGKLEFGSSRWMRATPDRATIIGFSLKEHELRLASCRSQKIVSPYKKRRYFKVLVHVHQGGRGGVTKAVLAPS